jgi:hypothetical protein
MDVQQVPTKTLNNNASRGPLHQSSSRNILGQVDLQNLAMQRVEKSKLSATQWISTNTINKADLQKISRSLNTQIKHIKKSMSNENL